ncbi:hypothetical protein T4C_5801 [Trichinella pseudospiralis]|uniref:Uncharacterized protein n=1 Tax=Trichinella pseudospiralis TaxID=6337 RepID=A0A0V1K3T3_TRIPS|nr:hypothetical protein T4C_5801 [Trichinella pseudospiralis]
MVAVGVGGAKLKCREKRLYTDTLRRVLTKSVFCCGTFCQIVYILTEFRMSSLFKPSFFALHSNSPLNSICNALEAVFTATCAVSDFYANRGGFKIVFANDVRRMNNGVFSAMADEE